MPALARRKTLPQSYWIYGDLTDRRTKEVFLRREILRDLPSDAAPEVRLNADVHRDRQVRMDIVALAAERWMPPDFALPPCELRRYTGGPPVLCDGNHRRIGMLAAVCSGGTLADHLPDRQQVCQPTFDKNDHSGTNEKREPPIDLN